MQQPQEIRKFKGLIPNIDRTRVSEPFVVDGVDFIVDIDGPISGLSRAWLFHQDIAEPRGVQTLDTADADDKYYCLGDCLAKYDVASRQLYPVYSHTARQEFWPWTRALVGNVLYLANKEVGLISYDPVNGVWAEVAGANIPATVYACAEAGGRLVILGPTAIHWSTIDDGTNTGFAPSTATGAGFQGLSILSSRTQPLMLVAYSFGVLAFTKDGIIRSELTTAANPFRHKVISRRHKLLNPWAITNIVDEENDKMVFMTPRGMFITDGTDQPKIWQALMSEHFHVNVIPKIPHDQTDMTIRLDYNFENGWFVISFAEDGRSSFYTKAFVLNLDEWGVYSRNHTGIIEVYQNSGPNEGFDLGVCSNNGTVYTFSKTNFHRVYPEEHLWQVDYKTFFDLPPEHRGLAGTTIFRTMMLFNTDPISQLDEAGVYNVQFRNVVRISPAEMPTITLPAPASADTEDWGSIAAAHSSAEDWGSIASEEEASEDWGFIITDLDTTIFSTAITMQCALIQMAEARDEGATEALGASITVGPFQLPERTNIDVLSQTQNAIINMLESGVADTDEDYVEDYLDADVDEDWNLLSGDEDWGVQTGLLTDYQMEFHGTVDGYTIWRDDYNNEQRVTPTLSAQEGKSRHVSGVVAGLYIYAQFTTDNLGEMFYLKNMRLNMTSAGRLM